MKSELELSGNAFDIPALQNRNSVLPL